MLSRRVVTLLLFGALLSVGATSGFMIAYGALQSPQLVGVLTVGDDDAGQTHSNWTKRTAARPLARRVQVQRLFVTHGKAERADFLSVRSFVGDSLFQDGDIAELRRQDVERDLSSLEQQLRIVNGGSLGEPTAADLSPLKLMSAPALVRRGALSAAPKRRARHAGIPLPRRVKRR